MLEIRGHVVMGFREGEEEQHLIIPEGIEAIAPEAFQNCETLKSVRLPDSLEEIGERAFAECSDLRTIRMPKHLERLQAAAFIRSGLTSVTIPEGVYVVPKLCFYECHSLRKVTLHEGLRLLARDAFCGCPIMKIQLPSTVVGLERGCLNNLKMDSITLPRSLEFFENTALSVKVRISANNRYFTSYKGALYDKAFRKLVYLPVSMLDATLPERVTELGWCIMGYGGEHTLTLPDQFTSIDDFAFADERTNDYLTAVKTFRLRHPRCTVTLPIMPDDFWDSLDCRFPVDLIKFMETHDLEQREKMIQKSFYRLPLALYLMLSADSAVGRAIFESNLIDTLEPMLAYSPSDVLLPLMERKLIPLAAVDDLIELANQKHCSETQLLLLRYKQECGGYTNPADELRL